MTRALILLLALASCAPPPQPVPAVGEYCRIARPIGYDSTADSAETVAAIERHNSQWLCVCEGDCPKASPEGGNGAAGAKSSS